MYGRQLKDKKGSGINLMDKYIKQAHTDLNMAWISLLSRKRTDEHLCIRAGQVRNRGIALNLNVKVSHAK